MPGRERAERAATIHADGMRLDGILVVPVQAVGVVLFAHGSGSGRFSPRNTRVARHLQDGGLATLLLDLLEEAEATDRRRVFDIPLLAGRLRLATDWVRGQEATRHLPIGYFGASTGAGAALQAAAQAAEAVKAVVSRGGRPDLAATHLAQVTAPTLLIVGGQDAPVLELNREAYATLLCPKRLSIVPGATHLFEEPGALEQVAAEAREWFVRHLSTSA